MRCRPTRSMTRAGPLFLGIVSKVLPKAAEEISKVDLKKQQQLQDFAGLYATTGIHSITQINESKQRGGLPFCYVLYSALFIYASLG